MPPKSAPPANRTGCPTTRIGVGIDTSRYGHHAAFLRDDLQPAAAELQSAGSGGGYAQLRGRLEDLAGRHPGVCFLIRLDAAGQYADNLLHFLHGLATHPLRQAGALPSRAIAPPCGDPQRNKNYRAALFGGKQSDPIKARAAARFALGERPTAAPIPSAELRALRQVAARLHAA